MKEVQYISGDFLALRDAWDTLSLEEQAEMIKAAVSEGIFDLKEIRHKYNQFAKGGSKEGEEEVNTDRSYINTMERVAEENYRKWGYDNPDEALIHALNDNTYNYRGYYEKYPQSAANADTHWPDEFKTVYHPTFSRESIYSGEKSQYNPNGRTGGFWLGELFVPAPWQLFNNYAEGGGIHIKPSHRGRLTELKKRTGKSEAELYRTGSAATRKMITFARNARKWKHGEGGPLFSNDANIYGFGDWLKKAYNKAKETVDEGRKIVKDLKLDKSPGELLVDYFTKKDESPEESKQASRQSLTYRNRPAERRTIVTPNGKSVQVVPVRQRRNNSPTSRESEKFENSMRGLVLQYQNKAGGSNPEYDIPFIPDKAIIIDGTTTSTNALDSLAKYAGIHNRDVQLSENHSNYSQEHQTQREINFNEMLGLSTQETHNGAWPYINMKKGKDSKEYNRALGNSNYFTAFGYIPADNFVRNYHYNNTGVDRATPPLLDAFRYFAQGDYNRGEADHTQKVNAAGRRAWQNPKVQEWWETSGKYWYNNPNGPKKK